MNEPGYGYVEGDRRVVDGVTLWTTRLECSVCGFTITYCGIARPGRCLAPFCHGTWDCDRDLEAPRPEWPTAEACMAAVRGTP